MSSAEPFRTTFARRGGQGGLSQTMPDNRHQESFLCPAITETESTTTTYYVRSTDLGGKVLTEIDPENNHTRTFVYAGGVVLATQESWGIPFVWWEHRDPSNATYRTTFTDSHVAQQAELDPLGANAGISNGVSQSFSNEGSLSPYPSFSTGSDLGTTYSWDGIRMPANEFFQTVGALMHGRFGVLESSARASAPRFIGYTVSTYNGRLNRYFGSNL